MDLETVKLIVTILFLAVAGFFAVMSLLTIYILIRYGRTKSLAILISLVFTGIFLLGTLQAYLGLQQLF
jgi:hypothetical protein